MKQFLQDASKRVGKADDRILDDVNKFNGDRKDANKARNVDGSCKAMKDLVDEILGRTRPKVHKAVPGKNVGTVSNKDIAEAARQLIKAADNTDKFRDDSPVETADKASDTSNKAVDLYDKVKKVAETTPNRELARALANAERELPNANDEMVAGAERYIGAPQDRVAQGDLHSSLENLKRIANDVLREVAPELGNLDLDNNVPANASMDDLRAAYNKAKASLDKQQQFDTIAPSATAERTKDSAQDTNAFKNLAAARAKHLAGDKGREADDLIRKLDKDNRDLYPTTQKYFNDPNPNTSKNLKNHGGLLHGDLDAVFNAVRPRAQFTKADFNQPARDVSDNEIEQLAGGAKNAIEPISGFAGKSDEANADETTEASRRMARFTEAVYLKAGDKHMPAVSGTKLREVSRDLVDKNQALVRAQNAYLDQPDNPETNDKLRNAVRAANGAVDKAVQAVKDASSSLKSFEDQIENASNAIRAAANEWDADDDIVAAALRIAEEMRRLAQAAREQNRKEIILRARNIAALVKSEIIEYANKRRDGCKVERDRTKNKCKNF